MNDRANWEPILNLTWQGRRVDTEASVETGNVGNGVKSFKAQKDIKQ